MSNNLPINADIRQIVGIETTWEQEPSIIGKGIIVLTRDTDIWKQGDGTKTYIELEKLFKSTQYDELDPDVQLGFLDFNVIPDTNIEQLVEYKDDDKIHPVLPPHILEILRDNVEDKSIFSDVYISGPNKIKLNKSYKFNLCCLYNITLDFNINPKNQFSSEWIIHQNKKMVSNKTSITLKLSNISNSFSVGDTVVLYGRIKDNFLNLYSKWVKKEILIISHNESINDNYIDSTDITLEDDNEIFIEYLHWNNNIHYSKHKYILSVKTRNKLNRVINVFVKCSDPSVKIFKINKYNNYNNKLQKFLIEYPEYENDTILIYSIYANDTMGNFTKSNIIQVVHKL